MNRKSAINFTSAFIAATALAALGCGCQKKQDAAAAMMAMRNAPAPVQVAKPIHKSVDIWDEYTARVEALEFVEVRARVGGYLESVNFKEGDRVKKGDLLFVIDKRPYEAACNAAKAAVGEVEARLMLAKSNQERAKELFAAKAVSKETYETRNSELLSAQSALLAAKAKLRDAELNLDWCDVRAPISGRVSERLVDAGNLINANTTLLTDIVNDSVVQAYFEISERDIHRYNNTGLFKQIDIVNHKGPTVQFLLMDETKPLAGQLTYFDNRLGRETSSLTMRADFPNSDGKISVGMFGKIKVLGEAAKKTVLFPEEAIGTDLVNRYVLVCNKDKVSEYRPVKVGRLLGKYRIIEEGLSPDESAVVVGLQRATPGRKLVPELVKLEK